MEAIGQLAGGIAHDFNNILTAIVGFASVSLRRVEPEDPLHRNLSAIVQASDRAASLVSQLLAFSRKQLLQPRVCDLNDVLRSVEPMLHRLIGEEIQLELALDETLGRVRLDPSQIEQVILNLAVNARTAMPRGGTLTLSTGNAKLDEAYALTHSEVTPGSYVGLSVADTGIGMDRETQARIFEPFFTTQSEGTGLGLASVYGIVRQSGGHIWVYSEPGQGATFKLYFPRIDETVETPAGGEEQADGASTGTETTLVVEDDPVIRKLLQSVLTANGYRVLEATTGEEALDVAASHESGLDLVVTDFVLPGMNGPELVGALRARNPGLRALLMSGYAEDAVAGGGEYRGDDPFLSKPFTPNELARKVRETLDRGA
jgi:CheY-like chemotaxis protein